MTVASFFDSMDYAPSKEDDSALNQSGLGRCVALEEGVRGDGGAPHSALVLLTIRAKHNCGNSTAVDRPFGHPVGTHIPCIEPYKRINNTTIQ